jgi:hypothetical protein
MTKRRDKPQTQPLDYQPGQRLGNVRVLQRKPRGQSADGSVLWLCVCDCNKVRWLRANNLNNHAPKKHGWCKRGEDYNPTVHGELP